MLMRPIEVKDNFLMRYITTCNETFTLIITFVNLALEFQALSNLLNNSLTNSNLTCDSRFVG